MANAKHQLITFTYTLDPAPLGTQTLGVVLVLLDDLDLDGTGERTKTFASKTEIDAAVVAAELSADQGTFVKKVFDQLPRPSKVRLGNADIIGLETYADAYNAVKAVTSDFFYVTAQTRTTSEILVLAAALASDFAIYVAQSAAAACLGNEATVTAEFTNSTQENFVLLYHPTSTELTGEALDICYAAARGTFDPDAKSVGWQGVVRSVADYPDGSVTSSDVSTVKLTRRVNLMLDVEGTNRGAYVSPGVTYTGRQIKTMVSVFWYIIRATEDLIATKLEADDLGDLIPVDEDGQAIVRAALEAKYDYGVGRGHFKAEQQLLTFPDPITDSDVANGIIRTDDHRITVLQNGEEFILSTAFTRSDVVIEISEA